MVEWELKCELVKEVRNGLLKIIQYDVLYREDNMPKKDHDERVAKHVRSVNYQKGWFNQGIQILKHLKMNNFSILDLGCGNGEFSEMVRDNFNADVFCLDYVDSHLSRVRSLGFKTINCNFDCNEDVEILNKNYKRCFDVVASFEVIEHIFDVDSFLSTIHNLLKANGFLIISTPNITYLSHRIYSAFRGNIPVGEGHHVRFFNPRRLRQVLFLNGFDVIHDYSYERGNYYLNRALGENQSSLRSFCINALFRCWYSLIPKTSPSYYSHILFLAKKVDAIPLGLDPTFRNMVFNKCSIENKKKIINRLYPLRIKGFFDEHPGLRKFIDEEKLKDLKG